MSLIALMSWFVRTGISPVFFIFTGSHRCCVEVTRRECLTQATDLEVHDTDFLNSDSGKFRPRHLEQISERISVPSQLESCRIQMSHTILPMKEFPVFKSYQPFYSVE